MCRRTLWLLGKGRVFLIEDSVNLAVGLPQHVSLATSNKGLALTFLIGFLWLLRGYGSISHCSQLIPPTFTMSVAE
jgi:hypothetical protein